MIMDIDLVVGIGMCLVLFSHLLYLWHFTMAVFIDAKNSGQIKLRLQLVIIEGSIDLF